MDKNKITLIGIRKRAVVVSAVVAASSVTAAVRRCHTARVVEGRGRGPSPNASRTQALPIRPRAELQVANATGLRIPGVTSVKCKIRLFVCCLSVCVSFCLSICHARDAEAGCKCTSCPIHDVTKIWGKCKLVGIHRIYCYLLNFVCLGIIKPSPVVSLFINSDNNLINEKGHISSNTLNGRKLNCTGCIILENVTSQS